MKIAVLSTSSNLLLMKTIQDMGHEARLINPLKAYMVISSNAKGYDKMFYGDQGDKPEQITKGMFDAVIPRIGSHADHGVNVLNFMVETLGIYCPITPSGILIAADKGKTLHKLSLAGVRVPKTILAHKPAHLQWIIDQLGSSSLIIKTLKGSQGSGVMAVDSKLSANSVLKFVYNQGLSVLLEEFIDAGAVDYRCWVVGGKVVSVMKRSATAKGEFKANISTGGIGEPATLTPEEEAMCVKAAAAIGLEGCCAVDLMKDKELKTSYIIEGNGNGGEYVIEATGINHWESYVAYVEEKTGKKPASRKIKRLPGTKETDGVNRATWARLIRQTEAETAAVEANERYSQERIDLFRDDLRRPR